MNPTTAADTGPHHTPAELAERYAIGDDMTTG